MSNTNKAKIKTHPTIQALLAWVSDHRLKIILSAYFAFMWSWALQTDTLNLAGNKNQGITIATIVIIINVAISVMVMSYFFKLVSHIFRISKPQLAIPISLALLALADFLVSWVPAAVWIGPEGRLDSVLPLSSPTLILINTPLSFAARFIGFYGLGGFFWLIALMVSRKKCHKYTMWPIGAVIVLAISGFVVWQQPGNSSINATIVSEKVDDRTPAISTDDTDLVIFPEYGLDKITNDNLDERIVLPTGPGDSKTYFLGSEESRPSSKVGHLNTLIYGDSTNGITQKQDKYRLIPGGEDLPYILRLGLRATNQVDTLHYFSFAKGVIKGPEQLRALTMNDGTVVGAAVCSSIISPEDYRNFTRNGAAILTNSASLSIFQGSSLFAWQQKSLAKFMAIANSRYFLQSANAARAYALDNNGQTIAEVYDVNTATAAIKSSTSKTPYTLIGEMLAIGGIAVLVALAMLRLKDLISTRQNKL